MEFRRISDVVWELPASDGMTVPGRIFASEAIMESVRLERASTQVANVTHLPG